MEELTIEKFTEPFDIRERVVICENRIDNPFYTGTIEHLIIRGEADTLNMRVERATVKNNQLYIIAHY